VSKPIILPNTSPAKYLLQNIRDEAHRFALGLHTSLARKRVSESQLEKISGIGPILRKKLIKRFGSMAAVKSASLEELIAVVG
jgi:excinuclease ABC subunit C